MRRISGSSCGFSVPSTKPSRPRFWWRRKPWVSLLTAMAPSNAASTSRARVKQASWFFDWMWISRSCWVAGARPLPSGVKFFSSAASAVRFRLRQKSLPLAVARLKGAKGGQTGSLNGIGAENIGFDKETGLRGFGDDGGLGGAHVFFPFWFVFGAAQARYKRDKGADYKETARAPPCTRRALNRGDSCSLHRRRQSEKTVSGCFE